MNASIILLVAAALAGVNDAGHGFLLDRGAYTDLRVPGAAVTVALGINNRGHIAGGYIDSAGIGHGYVLRDRVVKTIDHPRARGTVLEKLNDRGQIVGYTDDPADPDDAWQGFIVEGGYFTPIDVPGAVSTQPTGINNFGVAVGGYRDAGGVWHGFIRRADGAVEPLRLPAAVAVRPYDINDRGDIVGAYVDKTGAVHGFRRHGGSGVVDTIDVPGATLTEAIGVNDAGQIVGYHEVGTEAHAFAFDRGSYRTIDPPGSAFAVASDINNTGQITGIASGLIASGLSA